MGNYVWFELMRYPGSLALSSSASPPPSPRKKLSVRVHANRFLSDPTRRKEAEHGSLICVHTTRSTPFHSVNESERFKKTGKLRGGIVAFESLKPRLFFYLAGRILMKNLSEELRSTSKKFGDLDLRSLFSRQTLLNLASFKF